MRVLNHPPMFLSALIVLCSQSVSAAALDKNVKNILLEEAAETSMVKGVTVKDAVLDPSIIPGAATDYEALEESITSQIIQALGNDKEPEEPKQNLQNQLALDLEKVVSSALLQGNKLDDIRNAVAAAMSDIKTTGAAESEIPVDKIQSAELALKEIVSEGTASTENAYVISLKQELNSETPKPTLAVVESNEPVEADVSVSIETDSKVVASTALTTKTAEVTTEVTTEVEVEKALSRSTMSAVDSILATMSKTIVEVNKSSPVKATEIPDVKATQVESAKPTSVKEAPVTKTEAIKAPIEEPAVVSKPKLVALETTTVGKGETLFRVAKRVYGSGDKYLALYEANKDTIKNPDIIFVGQVLKVPR